jgi:hypothetical protein
MLLEAAGVKTVEASRFAIPNNCARSSRTSMRRLKSWGRVPALPMVNGWVTKAQKAPQL